MKFDFKEIGKNIFPGFVVSLVALPLSMGLALASGAPAVSGLIACIVGGILVSLFGGSHVTITGPGNGLVVVTLGAITTLGGDDMYQGYLFTLAAVVFSGVLLLIFGFLRLGTLSDYFPSAALQGLLAAIGLIIMAKQLHVMLGEMNPEGTGALDYLLNLPNTIAEVFAGNNSPQSYSLGLVSLTLMAVFPKIRNPILQIVPAPMWVVLLGILYTLASGHFGFFPAFAESHLIDLPGQVWNELAFPDFGKIGSGSFWGAVVALTFIASLESLLSIKAIDKLDPLNRRSNVNKDLRALGIGTIASGFLGGVNVVTVIARSSVNVNHGATQRYSNFFHGFFILIFILLFTSQLQMIPMPSLAAILVYTGYKLISPSVFRKIGSIGWEQLMIFIITLVATVSTNLLTGIAIGVLATLLTQFNAMGSFQLFIENLLRPNTLLIQENSGKYLLSVKAYANFLNFVGIKRKLDTVPLEAEVIIDFSLSRFVDYTVLEQLQSYYRSFRSHGGQLEIVGLDSMGAFSRHPLAPRRPFQKRQESSGDATRRQKSMRLFAKRMNWEFDRSIWFTPSDYDIFKYFDTRTIDTTNNHIIGKSGNIDILLSDVNYHEGEYVARENLHATMLKLTLPAEIPKFVMDRENLLDRVAYLAGFRDINFAKHPEFSRRFKLKGDHTPELYRFFDDELIDFFESNMELHVESNGEALLIFEKERLSTIREIKLLVSFADRLSNLLNKKLL